MPALCIRDLVKIVDGQLNLGSMPPLGGDLEPIGRIVVDCEDVEPGDVFWDLPAAAETPGLYAEQAFMRSASGAVVAGRHVEPWAGKFSIRVQDSTEALWRLAKWVRLRFPGQVIAVAGDDGRGTARRMLEQTLAQLQRVPHPGPAVNNWTPTGRTLNHSGPKAAQESCGARHRAQPICPPLGMLDWDEQDEYAIVEIHGDTEYEIDEISHLCCPHIAAITCTHHSVLNERHDSNGFETYVSDVLTSLPNDGWAILNGDDARLHRLLEDSPTATMWFGRHADCDIAARQIHCDEKGLSFHVARQRYLVPQCGEQHLMPALITIAVGRVLDWTDSQIASGLSRYQRKARAICW